MTNIVSTVNVAQLWQKCTRFSKLTYSVDAWTVCVLQLLKKTIWNSLRDFEAQETKWALTPPLNDYIACPSAFIIDSP